MKQPPTVRFANERELPIIAAFNQALARETEGKELAQETVLAGVEGLLSEPERGFYVISEADGEIVGSLMVTYEWSDWRNGVYWWIQSVYIKPRYRGRGIYRRMYEFLRTVATERETVRSLRLYVRKDNESAQNCYRKLGMQESPYKVFEETIG